MRAHPRGAPVFATAIMASLAAICGSSGCGEPFGGQSTADSGDAGTDAGAETGTSSFCSDEAKTERYDLCDSFDDRNPTSNVLGAWTEFTDGASDQISLSIDTEAGTSKPASLRVRRLTNGNTGGHFLRFQTEITAGQTWRIRGRLFPHAQPALTVATSTSFMPVVIRMTNAGLPAAHAFIHFETSADGSQKSIWAVGTGATPFVGAPTQSVNLGTWEDRAYAFELALSRPNGANVSPTASIRVEGASQTITLSDAPRVLLTTQLAIDLGGYTAAGGWDFHADDIVITHN